MKRSRLHIITVVIITLIIACGKPIDTSGSEIGNPVLTGVIRDDSNKPLYRAKVSLYSVQTDSIIDSAFTNNIGEYSLNEPEQGSYYLLAISGDERIMAYAFYDSTIIDDTLFLSLPGVLKGYLLEGFENTRIKILETPYSTTPDSMGQFRFDNIPEGRFKLIVSKEADTLSTLSFDLSSGDTLRVPDQYINVDSNDLEIKDSLINEINSSEKQVLLDDFEDKDHFNKVKPILGWGNWFTIQSDSSVELSPPTNFLDVFSPSIFTEENLFQNAFQFKVDIPESARDSQYGGFGVNLGIRPYNLVDMTGLEFEARGQGDLHIDFVRIHYKISEDIISSGYFTLPLDSLWQRYSVSPEDISIHWHDADTVVWEDFAGSISYISFTFKDSGSVILDNIILHNISLEDWLTP